MTGQDELNVDMVRRTFDGDDAVFRVGYGVENPTVCIGDLRVAKELRIVWATQDCIAGVEVFDSGSVVSIECRKFQLNRPYRLKL